MVVCCPAVELRLDLFEFLPIYKKNNTSCFMRLNYFMRKRKNDYAIKKHLRSASAKKRKNILIMVVIHHKAIQNVLIIALSFF